MLRSLLFLVLMVLMVLRPLRASLALQALLVLLAPLVLPAAALLESLLLPFMHFVKLRSSYV